MYVSGSKVGGTSRSALMRHSIGGLIGMYVSGSKVGATSISVLMSHSIGGLIGMYVSSSIWRWCQYYCGWADWYTYVSGQLKSTVV